MIATMLIGSRAQDFDTHSSVFSRFYFIVFFENNNSEPSMLRERVKSDSDRRPRDVTAVGRLRTRPRRAGRSLRDLASTVPIRIGRRCEAEVESGAAFPNEPALMRIIGDDRAGK